MAPLRRAVFLDRDGTIIEDRHYLSDPLDVVLLPGAAEAVRRLNDAGIPVFIVTNQSGIGRGYFAESDYEAVHRRMMEALAGAGAEVAATYHCPHAPDCDPPCDCRKPKPGLFKAAARDHQIDLGSSFYIGDRLRDLQAGTDLGGTGFLISGTEATGAGKLPEKVQRVTSLSDAVDTILRSLQTN